MNTPSSSSMILVVDDDLSVLSTVARILSRSGYRVLSAHGPQEALRAFSTHHHDIDAVLSDITMPGMDGVQLVRELRRSRPNLAVLFMTAYAHRYVDEPELLLAPVLSKPFAPANLVRQIELLLVDED